MTRLCTLLLLAAMTAATQGASVPERPALTLIVHKSNPIDSITVAQLRRLLFGESKEWPDHKAVILVQRETGSMPFEKMLSQLFRLTTSEYRRWLLAQEFQGRSVVKVKTLNSDDGACMFVSNVPGAIGIVGSSSPAARDLQIKVLRVDGKLPGEQGYFLQ